MAIGKRIPEETQKEVVRRAAQGEKVADLAAEFGFAITTFPKWKAKWGKVNHRAKLKVTTRKHVARKNVFQIKLKEAEDRANFWKDKYTELLYERNK